MQKIKLLAFVFLCLISLTSLASNVGIDHANSSSCNIDNSHNIGNYIKNYVMCGVSFLHPKDTLFGALSLILNVVCLTISLWLIVVNSTKYVAFTMRYGVPGGEKMQGGMMIVRSGLLVTFLTPCISNGFSPAQDLMRSLTELGIYIGDAATNRVIDYVSSEGGMIQHDPIGIDEVTTQIIASEMCRKMFILHHTQDVANGNISQSAALNSVRTVVKSRGLSPFSISWDYSDPFRNSQNGPMSNISDELLTTKENDSLGAACGYVTIDMPSSIGTFGGALHIHYDESTDTFKFSGDKPYQKPYAELINQQYGAVKTHILRIREIIKDIDVDLVEITSASAVSSQIVDEASLDVIEKAQRNEIKLANSVTSSAVQMVSKLVEANNKYRDDIVKIGQAAAESVNLTNNITTPDCEQPSPGSIVSPCVAGQSWENQLKEQGFAALGTYYFVYLVTNQKIESLQSHLIHPANEIKIYQNEYTHPLSVNSTTSAIASADSTKKLKKRSDSLIAAFQRNVESSNLNISFSSVENLGNSAEDTDHWYSWLVRKCLSYPEVTKGFANLIKGNGNGDLILHLVHVGNWLSGIATTLTLAIGAIWLGSKGGLGFATSTLSSLKGSEGGLNNIGSILSWIIVALFAASILFQYAIPAVPMFKWLLELQSWAIMMFMSLFFAPLWIMAHASITDDRFMAEQTMTGYGLAFELITRPLLMVASFWGMILLLHLADIGFQMMLSYLVGMGTYGTLGLLSFIAITVISLFVAYQLAMRTFDILAEFPDAIISRINFGAKPLGDTTRDGTMRSLLVIPQRGISSGVNSVVKTGAQKIGLVGPEKA